ncbi:helix-turn-helix domain-containing protein [Amaricoccus solimangrovi]|uniref:Helix-turn-helix domain-containing protein n=2 Tax=Amaricoccus solimangrovi TaxID=2589815 RepID=A0A501WY59_9RHOB|nr:helix-turn-helix domain-containing protein [Amaricoccus solimangrovi]
MSADPPRLPEPGVGRAWGVPLPETLSPKSVDLLQDDLRAVCGLFSIEPGPTRRDVVVGDVGPRSLGGVETAVVSFEATRVVRDARLARQQPGEHLFLLIQAAGAARITQGERSADLLPGDMYLVDSTLPSDFAYDGASTQISMHLPRREMLGRFGAICAGGQRIRRDDPLLEAMRAVVTKMASEPEAANSVLGEAFLGLLGAYFQCLSTQVSLRERAEKAVLSRALRLIDRHAPDPEFGPVALAERLNVSERTLQRHFRTLGETASRRILAARLRTAHARLVGARARPASASIAAIAMESGFNDLSYFYREFRTRYGVPPGAISRAVSEDSNPIGGLVQDPPLLNG